MTDAVADEDASRLLDRFAADAGRVLPMVALWAHGSLACGDFVPGRSDLDLVALVGNQITPDQRRDLRLTHENLIAQEPLATGLHCSYMVSGEEADPARDHLTWAHGELFERPVSPVSRRELCRNGLSLLGPAPATVVPAITDAVLAGYIRADLREYWYPKTDMPELWLEDIWVDIGMLTLARATVTLREGRLITKREALDVLASAGAPASVVRDIRERRYEAVGPISADWRATRGDLARAYIRQGIQQALGVVIDADTAALTVAGLAARLQAPRNTEVPASGSNAGAPRPASGVDEFGGSPPSDSARGTGDGSQASRHHRQPIPKRNCFPKTLCYWDDHLSS